MTKLTPGTVVLAGGEHRSCVTISRPDWRFGNVLITITTVCVTLLIVRIKLQLPIRSVDRSLLIPLVHNLS